MKLNQSLGEGVTRRDKVVKNINFKNIYLDGIKK